MPSCQLCDQSYITCFVGRLEKDTSEEDLCSYLDDVGIKDAQCHKLDDKDGLFRTAAFRVSCRDIYKDLFMMNLTGQMA